MLPAVAQNSSTSSSTRRVGLEVRKTQGTSTTVHRAPERINIEANYNVENHTLEICYEGVTLGETHLFLNSYLIGYDSQINTSFQIQTPGLYKIEIITDNWIAIGYLQL